MQPRCRGFEAKCCKGPQGVCEVCCVELLQLALRRQQEGVQERLRGRASKGGCGPDELRQVSGREAVQLLLCLHSSGGQEGAAVHVCKHTHETLSQSAGQQDEQEVNNKHMPKAASAIAAWQYYCACPAEQGQ